MTDEIRDFETETLVSAFKFKLTDWTLDQYGNLNETLQAQKNCLKAKCLGGVPKDFKELQSCV